MSSPLSFTSLTHSAGNAPLPTLILISKRGLSPPEDFSTVTSPLLPPLPPFNTPFGSKLCLLNGLSSAPPTPSNLRFLLLPSLLGGKRAKRLGARRNLTILLLDLDFFSLGVAEAGGGADGRDDDAEGATLGRGEGAALGRGDGAAEPLAVLVLILSFGAGRGMGDAIAGGVATKAGTLSGAGVGRAETVADAGGGIGVCTTPGAGVADLFFGCCMSGTSGVDARDSVLTTTGEGAGEAFVEGSTGDGEW